MGSARTPDAPAPPPAALSPSWSQVTAPPHYDLTAAEAKAAGWRPAAHAFSWHDTITHVGTLIFILSVGSLSETLDLDEVSVGGK